jgi:DNA polymerase theta
LTREERDIIETGYREGSISVLCATSTVGAGVNLPGKRVIFRSPVMGIAELDAIKYRQMSGRAGRAGQDDSGESILVIPKYPTGQKKPKNYYFTLAMDLMNSGLPSLKSCLTDQGGGTGMKRILLEAIAAGIVQTSVKKSLTSTVAFCLTPLM